MLLNSGTTELNETVLINAAMLVTRPGEAPDLKWIVDTQALGQELAAFQADVLGGFGTLTDHPPARGARHGYTELCVAVTDVPADALTLLPRRLQAAIAAY